MAVLIVLTLAAFCIMCIVVTLEKLAKFIIWLYKVIYKSWYNKTHNKRRA